MPDNLDESHQALVELIGVEAVMKLKNENEDFLKAAATLQERILYRDAMLTLEKDKDDFHKAAVALLKRLDGLLKF